MKKISILVLLVFAFSMTSCKKDATAKIKSENLKNVQQKVEVNKADAPVITFNKKVHDFGDINEGDVVETTFKFKNTGKTDLIITNIKGSCGCTVPSNWKKEPIKPGEESEFTVKFNSRNKPNKQNKTVTITANTATGRETVKISANVKPDPEAEKKRAESRKKRAELAKKRAAEAAKKQELKVK
jgi:hypothetical protein